MVFPSLAAIKHATVMEYLKLVQHTLQWEKLLHTSYASGKDASGKDTSSAQPASILIPNVMSGYLGR